MDKVNLAYGQRVMAFDATLYENDRDTPAEACYRPAVVTNMGEYSSVVGYVNNFVSVRFDRGGCPVHVTASKVRKC